MSNYTSSYSIRYYIPSLLQQAEVAVITAAGQIQNEDPGAPNHANRKLWADWAMSNSSLATAAFMWPIATNPSIVASVTADPSGDSVPDGDVQFVVNSNLDRIITDWVANKPTA